MADRGSMVLKTYDLQDMQVLFPSDDTAVLTYRVTPWMSARGRSDAMTRVMADSSTWVRNEDTRRYAIHTETPLQQRSH